jgi:methyl-accepting chemotaxis protein
MSEALQIALIMLGTAIVVLLAVLTGALLVTLLELRKTARQVNETLQRLEPGAAETLENLRQASGAASQAMVSVSQLSRLIEPMRDTAQRVGPYLPVLGGLGGLLMMLRTLASFRGGRRGSKN